MNRRSVVVALSALLLVVPVALAFRVTSHAEAPPDAERGRALFLAKQCDRCHIAGGGAGFGPGLEDLRRPQGSLELVGRLWNHVPAMWATVTQQGLRWPEFDAAEMADLMAYLRADAARDARPDPAKGQVVLIRKGCLKCHSYRREGGGIQPDLAVPRGDYASATAWAATMWTHTPRMVGASTGLRVPYPRFSGDEMSNLLGYLRGATTVPPAGSSASPGR